MSNLLGFLVRGRLRMASLPLCADTQLQREGEAPRNKYGLRPSVQLLQGEERAAKPVGTERLKSLEAKERVVGMG